MNSGWRLIIAGVLSMVSMLTAQTPAPTAPMQLSLKFYNREMRQSGQPLPLKYGEGMVLVELKWTPVFTDKDDVQYTAWIRGDQDWASANAPAGSDEAGALGFRQYAYIGKVRAAASSGTRIKMQLDYRPEGFTSFPLSSGTAPLPAAQPLPPGTHHFTACVQRTGPGGKTKQVSAPFAITVAGEATAGSVYGLSSQQVIQRSGKQVSDVSFLWAAAPAGTPWEASVNRAGEAIANTSGSSSAPVTEVRLSNVPVGGPYEIRFSAAGSVRTYKDVYVGDLWIISGQSNAVGCGGNAALGAKPMPGVHCLEPKYGIREWAVARDGLFEQTVGAWVTAAQQFYAATGVPVGLMGHAVGSKPIDYFLNGDDAYILRPIVERHGQKAAAFFWYQGESDSFQPAQEAAYGQKLTTLVKSMRQMTRNPDLMVGVCQLGRYTWFKDDHFAKVREAQRQFVLQDHRAVLYSTLAYLVNEKDKIHLETAGYIALGKQIGRQMIELESTGKAVTPGPTVQSAAFAGGDRRQIVLTFSRGEGLSGNPSPDEWFVTDETHRGFKEGGFVPVEKITIDPEAQQVRIELKQAPAGATAVSYGYRSDLGGSLANAEGYPAVCFVRVPVQ